MPIKLGLSGAIEALATKAQSLSDADLEQPWAWQDYDEGVRHMFFRTYEELRELAIELALTRAKAGNPISRAQRILAQYHTAYRDLLGVSLGVNDDLAEQAPAEGEWSLRAVLLHIVDAERAFFAVIYRALEKTRTGDNRPLKLSEESWEAFWAGDTFESHIENQGSFTDILDYYQRLHQRVLHEFASITEKELEKPSMFWESVSMPVQFRLHRFDSHLKQHIVQAEKTLVALDRSPTEARSLSRLIYSALGELEGTLIGAWETGLERRQYLAAEIAKRTGEITNA